MNYTPIKRDKHRSIDVIFTLLLFCVFTFMIMTVLISGVGVYKQTEEIMTHRYEERTAIAYIVTKLRQGDAYNAISVASHKDIDTLVIISEEIWGYEYLTYVYCFEGWIYELFAESTLEFNPALGTQIIEASELNFSMSEPDLLYIEYVSADGNHNETHINLRSLQDKTR